MQCPKCNNMLEDGTVFCGNCGTQIAPLHNPGATVSTGGDQTVQRASYDATRVAPPQQQLDSTMRAGGANTYVPPNTFAPPAGQQPAPGYFDRQASPPSPGYFGDPAAPSLPQTPVPPRVAPRTGGGGPGGNDRRRLIFIAAAVAILVAVIAGSAFAFFGNKGNTPQGSANTPAATTAPGNATTPTQAGQTGGAGNALAVASFSDAQDGKTGAVKISATGLAAPAAGKTYQAWMANLQTEQFTLLGPLTQQGDTFALDFKGDKNLLTLGDTLLISEDASGAAVPGTTVVIGSLPPKALVHIKHVLVSFPNVPQQNGLAIGLRDHVATLAGFALSYTKTNDPQAIPCVTQAIINVIEGAQGQNFRPLPSQCLNTSTGDGVGILGANNNGYLALTTSHAKLAADAEDATDAIKLHSGHVQICAANLNNWVGQIHQNALAVLANPADQAKIQQIVALASTSLNGKDTNGNEQVEPIQDEGGVLTLYNHSQLMAQMNLAPKK